MGKYSKPERSKIICKTWATVPEVELTQSTAKERASDFGKPCMCGGTKCTAL